MACVLTLVRRDDYISDVDEIDLLAGGYSLATDGYLPVVAPLGAQSVYETITLKLQGTSKNDLASLTQALNDKIRQVQWWLEEPGVERYQIWIRSQLDGESYQRQAQILNIQPPEKVMIYNPVEINANWIGEYTIGIERTPFWEDADPAYTEETYNALSTLGGASALAAAVDGDVSARMVNINAICANTGSKKLVDFWFGIKTDRFGTPGNFVPLWELNDASWTATDVASTADAEASSGTALLCDFSNSELLVKRVIMTVAGAVADSAKHPDQRGTYQVILRARLSNAIDTVLVRMQYGYMVSAGDEISTPVILSRVPVSLDEYRLYDLGTVRIPPNRVFSNFGLGNFAIQIDAERDPTLTVNLYLDCLILIPIDDAFIKASTGQQTITDAIDVQIFQGADDALTGYVTSGNTMYGSVVFSGNSHQNWSMPISTVAGRLIVAAQGGTSDKDDAINVELTYIKRWRTLRGNAT